MAKNMALLVQKFGGEFCDCQNSFPAILRQTKEEVKFLSPLSSRWGGGSKAIVAGPLKKTIYVTATVGFTV